MPFIVIQRAAIVALAIAAALHAPYLRDQSAKSQAPDANAQVPQWQIAAGGHAKFDVVSVKQNNSGPPPEMGGSGDRMNSNVRLDSGEAYAPNGGLFRVTNWPLIGYIIFAYKIDANDFQSLQSELPKWTATDRFDIEARAQGNPTKDQMRLMLQDLLADRFKLSVHTESRQLPVFALALEKPEKLGPQLRIHTDNPPCEQATTPGPNGSPTTIAGGFPAECGTLVGQGGAHIRVAARNMTIGTIGSYLGSIGQLGRPVIDGTGLHGTFDFTIDFVPDFSGPRPPSADPQPDTSGMTLLEALKDQLGLKLVSQTGPVDIVVIDHLEQPSPN